MVLITDTREAHPLQFEQVVGVSYVRETMTAGDYTARHQVGTVEQLDSTVFERKAVGDLFASFTAGYTREKAKWQRAQTLGLTYILAIEATCTEILKGHTYWQGGELREAKKSGIAMIRQLMSLQRRYGLGVWFCSSRREMALRIQEYFLSFERMPPPTPGGT